MSIISIGIVDDDVLVVNLLENHLNKFENITVLFSASSGDECLHQLNELSTFPDIILLDLKMKGMDGIELLNAIRLKNNKIKCIVISSYYRQSFCSFMFKTGAAGFVPKSISPSQLLEVIQNVYTKGFHFQEDQLDLVREQLLSSSPLPNSNSDQLLSERELEILKLICQQKTSERIGKLLRITRKSVEGHKNNMYAKTGAKNLAGLVIYAIQNQIISSENIMIL